MQGLWNTLEKPKNRDTENWGQTAFSECPKDENGATTLVLPPQEVMRRADALGFVALGSQTVFFSCLGE